MSTAPLKLFQRVGGTAEKLVVDQLMGSGQPLIHPVGFRRPSKSVLRAPSVAHDAKTDSVLARNGVSIRSDQLCSCENRPNNTRSREYGT